MISEEIPNQMSRNLNEIKTSLNFQIHDEISNAITEKILPSIQKRHRTGEREFHHGGPRVRWATG